MGLLNSSDFVHCDPPDHGPIEIRTIWTTTELNGYLNFPHVGQAFLIQRESTNKETGEYSCEIAYGITSRTPEQANPQRVLATNRGHWSIENSCHYIIDWNYDDSPLASLSPKVYAVSHGKCDSSWGTFAWYLTICE